MREDLASPVVSAGVGSPKAGTLSTSWMSLSREGPREGRTVGVPGGRAGFAEYTLSPEARGRLGGFQEHLREAGDGRCLLGHPCALVACYPGSGAAGNQLRRRENI